jgi:hypothetical protein
MTPPARPGFRAAGPADIIAGMKGFRNRRFFEGPQRGGATLIAVLLVACLLAGMAAGFTARALTGERRRASAGKHRATGCAVLLELARVSKNNNKTVPNVQFIFLGGEEIATGASADDHHWGSRYFVTTMSETDRRALASMIAVDMVGAGDTYLASSLGVARPSMKDDVTAVGAPAAHAAALERQGIYGMEH